MNEEKALGQIIKEVDDMLSFLEKEIGSNQRYIQDNNHRITEARAVIENCQAEIKRRVEAGEELAGKLATWRVKREELEKLA